MDDFLPFFDFEDKNVHQLAATGLARLGDARGTKALWDIYKDINNSAWSRYDALGTLADLGDRNAEDTYEKALIEAPADDQTGLYGALSYLDNPKYFLRIKNFLKKYLEKLDRLTGLLNQRDTKASEIFVESVWKEKEVLTEETRAYIGWRRVREGKWDGLEDMLYFFKREKEFKTFVREEIPRNLDRVPDEVRIKFKTLIINLEKEGKISRELLDYLINRLGLSVKVDEKSSSSAHAGVDRPQIFDGSAKTLTFNKTFPNMKFSEGKLVDGDPIFVKNASQVK